MLWGVGGAGGTAGDVSRSWEPGQRPVVLESWDPFYKDKAATETREGHAGQCQRLCGGGASGRRWVPPGPCSPALPGASEEQRGQ